MRPQWEDAPAWAQYLTCIDNGHWEWHELRPSYEPDDVLGFAWWSTGRIQRAYALDNCIEERPGYTKEPIALRAARMEAEIRLFIEWNACRGGPDDAMLPKEKQPRQIRDLMSVVDWE